MAGKPDIEKAKRTAERAIKRSIKRYTDVMSGSDYLLTRWTAEKIAGEIYSAWEWYAEERLVIALCRSPEHFIKTNAVRGVRHVSKGLSRVLVRGTRNYFDFRSTGDLLGKADDLVGKDENPFRATAKRERDLLDVLAAVRNFVIHGSEFAKQRYRSELVRVYGMVSIPGPGEFLSAVGRVPGYTVPRTRRVSGLAFAVLLAIRLT